MNSSIYWQPDVLLFIKGDYWLLDRHSLCLQSSTIEPPQRPAFGKASAVGGKLTLSIDWNSTETEFPDQSCLHELFENQARSVPDLVAVIHGDAGLTYRELDKRADRLAYELQERGVGPDDVVAVLLDRSLALVVALLGVLKAGGAYLPLELDSPDSRLDRLLSEAGVTICVTTEARRAQLPDRIQMLSLDGPVREPGPGPSGRPTAVVQAGNLVSVYFTSGSTGVPKGVASTHRGWVNRMHAMQRRHGLQAGETVLHKTTLTFDDSALELFWPLAHGGRVALLDPEEHRDPRSILDAAVRYRTVLLQVVPSMLNMILETITVQDRSGLTHLRSVVSSGEALSPATVARFRSTLSQTLYNTWGATEVSIDSSSHRCGEDDETASGAVCLGLPFDNNQIYVLDDDLQELAPGEVGELYIGGIGLARGYFRDPGKTAAAFVPNPFRSGERMYRTGDQGLRRPDGALIFAGRNDHQVKIRGMRVELGEIEVELARNREVKEAVVVVQRADGEPDRLVGYVVLSEQAAPAGSDELRAALAARLPAHMVPSAILVLERFPLSAHGKIDKARLPRWSGRSELGKPLGGPAEEALAQIWSELLGVSQIVADDDFFALGGHSLLATRLTARVRDRFEVELPLRVVFDRSSLTDMAAELERLLAERIDTMTPAEVQALLGRLRPAEPGFSGRADAAGPA